MLGYVSFGMVDMLTVDWIDAPDASMGSSAFTVPSEYRAVAVTKLGAVMRAQYVPGTNNSRIT